MGAVNFGKFSHVKFEIQLDVQGGGHMKEAVGLAFGKS